MSSPIRASINTSSANRVSINNQQRQTIRTVGMSTNATVAEAAFNKANSANVLASNSYIDYEIDGYGNVITTGIKGSFIIPYSANITEYVILGDTTGNTSIDIYKNSYDSFPTINASTSITSNGLLTILGQNTKNRGTSTAVNTINAGDILTYRVLSCNNFTKLTVSLYVTKT